MVRSRTIGRIRGIDINVHPTFALVLLWVFFQWGRGSSGGPGAMLFGLVLLGLVFGCVVLHELGHSFMALQHGIRVHDITLWPMGGVARIEQVPARPRAEVLIALAGPAVNVAIAVALLPPLALFGLVSGFRSPGDYLLYVTEHVSPGALLVYLFFVNVVLLLFNLLPAFPMDGGRVLRALLSKVIGRENGTRVAVIVGQVLALALIVVGLWHREYSLPLIGVFVIFTAHVEGRAVKVESAMRRLRVGQFALWDMGGIAPHHPLTYALRGGPRDVAVTEDGRVVGMLWRNQVLHGLNGGAGSRTVADVMDSNVVTADIDDSVYDVQQRMNQLNRWAIPVTEDGQYRGIFTADRFVHVYRQLSSSPLTVRTPQGLTNTVTDVIRAWGR